MSIFQEFIMSNKEKGNLYLKVLVFIFISFMGVTLGGALMSGKKVTYDEIKVFLLSFLTIAYVLCMISIFINKKNKNL